MKRRFVPWALVAGLAFTVPASAQSPADRLAARKLAGEAMDLFEAGDYGTALDKFTQADELVPAPTLKLRIARSLDKLDRLLEAAEIYRAVIATELKPTDPAPYHAARKEAIPELAALLEQIPSVTVTVRGPGAAEAEVFLGGAALPRGVLGERREMDPGDYLFEARIDGREAREDLHLERGAKARVTLELPAPVTEAPSPDTPAADDTAWRVGGWAAVGVGAAALVVGAATGGVVMAREDDLVARCPDRRCGPEDHADAEGFNTLRTTSTAMFVVGGVAAAAGVAVLLLAPEREEPGSTESALTLRPLVGPGWFGIEGRFR